MSLQGWVTKNGCKPGEMPSALSMKATSPRWKCHSDFMRSASNISKRMTRPSCLPCPSKSEEFSAPFWSCHLRKQHERCHAPVHGFITLPLPDGAGVGGGRAWRRRWQGGHLALRDRKRQLGSLWAAALSLPYFASQNDSARLLGGTCESIESGLEANTLNGAARMLLPSPTH